MQLPKLRLPSFLRTTPPLRSARSIGADVEAQESPPPSGARFEYAPGKFIHRLLVGARLKNKLESSKIVQIPYRVSRKYILILLLVFIAFFFTPQLLPRWIGFEWASPKDLCQKPDKKLQFIHTKLRNLSRLTEATTFLKIQRSDLQCMEMSAEAFYHGPEKKPPRFQWPDECTSEIAQVSLLEETCVSQEVNVCKKVGGFAGFLISVAGSCEQSVGPDLCVNSTNTGRAEALLRLEQQRGKDSLQNATEVINEPILSTANERVNEIIERLMTRADFASDAFILYSMISIAIGVPLIIYKREKGSRLVGATFGLTKASFVLSFVVAMAVYDSAVVISNETNFAILFQNFLNDPCYMDPGFSIKRAEMIVGVCNNISYIERESDHLLQRMDGVYYDARLFGFCKDENRELAKHPSLQGMSDLRQQYRSGNISSPGMCNATYLDEETSVAPQKNSDAKLKVLLGSGVLAQVALKFIVTSWVLHLFAFIEPLVIHNGKIEVWEPKESAPLNEEEKASVTRFARDKHLLPLIIFSLLLILEIVLVIYSIATTVNGSGEIGTEPISMLEAPQLRACPPSLAPT